MISCQAHDYIEIACMFHYKVELLLKDNSILICEPITTKFSKENGEQLSIMIDSQKQLIAFDTLVSMKVLTPNARFDNIDF